MNPNKPRNFHDICILQTKFGLKKYLWVRWVRTDTAQVHDGERVIAELIQVSPHRDDEWQTKVYDQMRPLNAWSHSATTFRNTSEDLGMKRLIREAIKAFRAANPQCEA